MAIAYQYDHEGFYLGFAEDYGFLPNNATYTKPAEKAGYIPCWDGKKWGQVENHKGQEGFLNGEPYTVKEYGPLPEGFSHTPPPPTPEEQKAAQKAQFVAAIQNHLDDFARTRGYDSIMSAATYATSTVAKFRAEGQCAVEARDATWATAYEILGAVESGKRVMPTLNEVIAELPPLVWPKV